MSFNNGNYVRPVTATFTDGIPRSSPERNQGDKEVRMRQEVPMTQL
jgi:hypothetical protein